MTCTSAVVDAVGGDDGVLRALGALRAEPLVQAAVDPCNGRAAHLERARGDALVDEAAGDGHLAAVEEGLAGVLGHAEHGGVEHDVAAGRFVDQVGAGHRLFDVDQCRQDVVVDDDCLGGVLALVGPLGDDHGDGLADVADLVDGEQTAGDRRVERRRHRLQPEVGSGVARR